MSSKENVRQEQKMTNFQEKEKEGEVKDKDKGLGHMAKVDSNAADNKCSKILYTTDHGKKKRLYEDIGLLEDEWRNKRQRSEEEESVRVKKQSKRVEKSDYQRQSKLQRYDDPKTYNPHLQRFWYLKFPKKVFQPTYNETSSKYKKNHERRNNQGGRYFKNPRDIYYNEGWFGFPEQCPPGWWYGNRMGY